jgi:integrase/recombinase XerD
MYQYKRTPLDEEEQDILINGCSSHREKLVVYTLLDTGMRVSELASLKRENVKWQAGVIEIYGKGGKYGTLSKRRTVSLSPRVKKILEIQFAMTDEMGLSVRTTQRVVRAVAENASISKRVTPHVLRHTFSVNAIRRGVNLRALQEALGHDHITTTEIYLNYSGKNIADDFRKMWE